jgi:prephenate dehydrogenase
VTQSVLGVAGVGLIGGSIALRAHAAGLTVVGYDRDTETVRAARDAGALDASVASLAELVQRCTMIVIALPVDSTVDVLANTPELAACALVFDVASVKAPIEAAAVNVPHFVASHPLAGRERGGFAAADAALFGGRTWAIVPARDAAAEARLTAFVTMLGARPLRIDAAAHDRLVAVSSHLPQVLSVVLGAVLAHAGACDDRVYDLCGPGMQSMLRLAASDPGLWAPIAQANAQPLADALDAAGAGIQSTAQALRAGDLGPLLATFAEAHRAVDALERSAGSHRSLPPTAATEVPR